MKKGFTLVELLGVVTIIGLLGLVVVPVLNKVISDNKNDLYDVQINNIKKGASNYISENVFSINIPNGDSMSITLGELKNLGYISKDISDPITGEKFDDNLIILIGNNNYGYQYMVCTEDVVCEF